MAQRSKRSFIGKVVTFTWRDSHQGELDQLLETFDEDCTWSAVGLCVKESDLFITISYGTRNQPGGQVHSPFSIPWTQILGRIKVLDNASS